MIAVLALVYMMCGLYAALEYRRTHNVYYRGLAIIFSILTVLMVLVDMGVL